MNHPDNTAAPTSELSPEGLDAVQFMTKKRKAGVMGTAMRGFGSNGTFTLFIPPPTAKSVIKFDGGKPRREHDASVPDPRILELRDRVLKSVTAGPAGMLTVDIAFLEYAAAIISAAYNVTDQDLEFLLNGSGWHDGMCRHAFGGDDVVRQLAMLSRSKAGDDLMRTPPPAPAQPKAKRKWWRW